MSCSAGRSEGNANLGEDDDDVGVFLLMMMVVMMFLLIMMVVAMIVMVTLLSVYGDFDDGYGDDFDVGDGDVDSDGEKQGLQNVDCAFQREDKYFQNVVNQIAHKRNLCILGHLVFCKKK